MAISVQIPGWRFRRELLMSGVSALAVVRGAQAGVRSYRTGHHGRRGLATALAPLPVAWEYFPAVRLDGRPAAVVAGPNGVFLLETFAAAGHVVANASGLIVRRKRDVRTLAQARRRAARLAEVIGQPVRPVIVVTSGSVDGARAGSTPVLGLDALLGFLVARPVEAIERPDLLSVFAGLEAMQG